MKPLKYLHKIKRSIISFVHLQLFITLISMPILLSWGMPLSLLTFAGNFLFSPILTAFLLLSSLIFFCEILHIPNGIFIWSLEHITHWWLWLMQWASRSVLVSFAMPSIPALIIIFLCTLAILHCKKNKSPFIGIAGYGILLAISCLHLAWPATSKDALIQLDCNKGKVTLIKKNKNIVVIDPGVIGRRLSAPSWCEYTLLSALAKQLGTNTIDHLIILQPNRIIFEALTCLQEKIYIKNIYIPYWDGQMPSFWLRSFMNLKRACAKHNCNLIRLSKKPVTVLETLTITPIDHQITLNEFNYPAYCVNGTINNENFSLFSSKYPL